ncbi:hypothetical protein EVAR_45741_1 [Eumeta japonica]|uniref:Uncharacterized protein n=1 Tax=Eumeta variegata TaxID=151549 RepID=A0A4C1YMZ5_EUMVA|nr:hypothetical protein EVAR_45741_1 [Eumeta japonica]
MDTFSPKRVTSALLASTEGILYLIEGNLTMGGENVKLPALDVNHITGDDGCHRPPTRADPPARESLKCPVRWGVGVTVVTDTVTTSGTGPESLTCSSLITPLARRRKVNTEHTVREFRSHLSGF